MVFVSYSTAVGALPLNDTIVHTANRLYLIAKRTARDIYIFTISYLRN